MKIQKLILIALFALPLSLHAQWTAQYPDFGEHYEINYIHAVNQNLVWAVTKDQSGNGYGPMFSVSQNSGESWVTGYITTDEYLTPAMVFAFDEFPYAFVPVYKSDPLSTGQAGIYATFDGGETWQRQSGAFETPTAWPDIVYFWSTTWGISIGDPVDGYFDIYTTNDLGTTWQKVPLANIPDPLPGEAAIVGNYEAVGSTIWFSTTKGRVYKSQDYGINWAVYSSPFSSFTRIAFKDNNNGWLQDVGDWETTQIAGTTDGGETWNLLELSGPLLNWDLHYIPGSANTLVSSGAYLNNGVSTSYNGGEDWAWIEEPGTKYFSMDWLDNQTGWAGGYDENIQKPLIYKYNGPGVCDYLVSPLDIYFGYVEIGTSLTRNITITNLGPDYLELTDIYTNIGIFFVTPSTCTVDPEGGQYYLEVTFVPTNEGVYEDWVTIISNHPLIPEITVHLMGDGFMPPANLIFDPESFDETLYSGQSVTKALSVTNIYGQNISYKMDVSIDPSLSQLGWNYGSTPFGTDDGILGGDADQAMFIKQFTLDQISNATLYIGCDDGGRFWVNGTLVLDEVHGDHGMEYWNYELDISPYLSPGINRISAVVFNGIFRGCCDGAFDCQLTVDGVDVIKNGFNYYEEPEAMWYYYGQSGARLVPPNDVNQRQWWEAGYGHYDWVGLRQFSGATFEELGWSYKSAPFTGADVLSTSPDNAQFIKDFEVGEYSSALLNLGFDDGCQVWLNGTMIFDFHDENHGLGYWAHQEDISGLLQPGANRLAVEVYNGIYSGFGTGGFDCELLVDDVPLIKRGDQNYGAPEAMWYVYGVGGQILTPPLDAGQSNWYESNYGLTGSQTSYHLTDLNWNFDSTPFFERGDILITPPDNAQFIKDFTINQFTNATLYLGFDDGCRVWLNGTLALDYHDEVHGIDYWNHENDISGMLQQGRNRIAVEVYNGVYGGGAGGSFDCQLIVDDVEIIKRGDMYPYQPQAMWYFYGQAGQVLTPPDDLNGLVWYEKNYGINEELFSTSLSGVIANGETQQFQVVLDAAGLSGGDYQTNIHFVYDVTKMEMVVPVNLHVNSGADLLVTPSTLAFGDYYLDNPESIKLTLKNQGFENLDIFNIWCESPDINVDNTNFTLEPGQSLIVTVTLNGSETGIFNAKLYIENSAITNPLVTLQISANRMWAPSLVIENLEYLYAYLASGQTETQNLYINNWGGSVLDFTIPQAQVKDEKAGSEKKPVPNVQSAQPQHPEEVIRTKEPAYCLSDIIGHKNLVVNYDQSKSPKVVYTPQINIFNDDMENGTENWTIENQGIGKSQWHQIKSNSYSPETSWWCGNELTGTFYNGYAIREGIISPEIKLPNVESVIMLEFNEFYDIEGMYDQGFVDLSLDGGNQWIRIREGIPGSSGGWVTTLLNISEYYGNDIRIRFFFDTGDDVANDFPGWFIDDVRVYVEGFNFLSISPGEGSLNPGEGFGISVNFDASGYNNGYYPGFIMLQTNDPQNQLFYLPAILEVWGGNDVQHFDIPAGWSGISSYLIPENPQLDQLLSPILNELVIFQNLAGVYWPQENLNTIGDWNFTDGYFLKLNSNASLEVVGTLPENRSIQMPAGWSLIPVLSFNPVPVTDFDPLESLNIIKEVAGTGIYWPVYNINTLQELQPGKSYFINVSNDEYFEYPPMAIKSCVFGNLIDEQLISPWNEVTRTAATHIVALPSESLINLEVGDIIGIFNTQGYCVGFVTINNPSKNQSMAVFGDDPTTSINEGILPGEKMEFRLLRSSTTETFALEVDFDKLLPDQEYFAVQGLSAISKIKFGEMLPGNLWSGEISVFPNPAGDFIKISSDRLISRIEISDAKGVVFLTEYPNNPTNPEVDLSKLQSGMYFVKIVTSGNTFIRKVIKQ